MNKYLRKLMGAWVLTGMVAATLVGCGGDNYDDDDSLMLGLLLTNNSAELNAVAETLVLKLTGMVIPEDQGRTVSSHQQASFAAKQSRAAASCSGGVCNGVLNCPLGGTLEFFNLELSNTSNVSGTVTTNTGSSRGRQVAQACVQPAARIVNGVLVTDRTVSTTGDFTYESSSTTSTQDSATGISQSSANTVVSFTGFSMDGSAPVDGNLAIQTSSTTTVTGKDVVTDSSINFTGTLNGSAVQGAQTYRFVYRLP